MYCMYYYFKARYGSVNGYISYGKDGCKAGICRKRAEIEIRDLIGLHREESAGNGAKGRREEEEEEEEGRGKDRG